MRGRGRKGRRQCAPQDNVLDPILPRSVGYNATLVNCGTILCAWGSLTRVYSPLQPTTATLVNRKRKLSPMLCPLPCQPLPRLPPPLLLLLIEQCPDK